MLNTMIKKISIPAYLCILLCLSTCAQEKDFDEKLKILYKNTVPLIKPQQLVSELNRDSSLVVLDCRESQEYETSHIQKAKNVGFNNFTLKSVQDIPKDRMIIVYCSAGYRSERIGEKLQKVGYTRVYNLYGGIFEWVNQDYPVYNSQNEKTKKVHVYSKEWGQWLKKGEKIYE